MVDDSYDASLLLVFDSVAGHDNYQVDPLHKKFVEECAHLWQKVQIYDLQDV